MNDAHLNIYIDLSGSVIGYPYMLERMLEVADAHAHKRTSHALFGYSMEVWPISRTPNFRSGPAGGGTNLRAVVEHARIWRQKGDTSLILSDDYGGLTLQSSLGLEFPTGEPPVETIIPLEGGVSLMVFGPPDKYNP